MVSKKGEASVTMKKMQSKEKWIFTAILAAIEIFLTATDLGFFSISRIAFTILHIPVFLAVTLIGLPQGVILAAIFGCSSMISAYLHPTTALDMLFQNPLISVVPRLMIPFAVWAVYRSICRIADDHTLSAKLICTGAASMSGVIANAAFVVFSVALVAPEAIGITESLTTSTIIVTNIVTLNMVYEMTISVIVTALTVLLLRKLGYVAENDLPAKSEGEGDKENTGEDGLSLITMDKPIKKTFHKWLFLVMSLTFMVMLSFLYNLFTDQDQQNVAALLLEKTEDITHMVERDMSVITQDDMRIGYTGVVILSKDDELLSTGLVSQEVSKLSDLAHGYENLEPFTVGSMEVNGRLGSGMISKANDILILSFVPESEIYAGRDRLLSLLLGGLLIFFFMLFELISKLVQQNVVLKIQDVNGHLSQIRAGNLNEKVMVSGNTEFEELSLGINTTVDALKDTMKEIEHRNRKELEYAREVQNAALPAGKMQGSGKYNYLTLGSMQAAKEVGGDFYDYFLIGEDKLGFLVADVSGKGVPAALFMMRAKTLINNYVQDGKSPSKALELANTQLCANNESGMFVTVWLGVLELETGLMEFANAAHNPPLLKRRGEDFVYMDRKTYRRGLVLAGLEGTQYHNNAITMNRGDMLFLYTDGVTEATNAQNELYGEKRLLNCLEKNYMLPAEELLKAVRADIDAFAAGTEQYDDITMLVVKFG